MKKVHITIWIGLAIIFIGYAPLIIGIGLDKMGLIDIGNALGFGLMAFASMIPGSIFILIGLICSIRNSIKR